MRILGLYRRQNTKINCGFDEALSCVLLPLQQSLSNYLPSPRWHVLRLCLIVISRFPSCCGFSPLTFAEFGFYFPIWIWNLSGCWILNWNVSEIYIDNIENMRILTYILFWGWIWPLNIYFWNVTHALKSFLGFALLSSSNRSKFLACSPAAPWDTMSRFIKGTGQQMDLDPRSPSRAIFLDTALLEVHQEPLWL